MRGYHDVVVIGPPQPPGDGYLAAYCVGTEEVDDLKEEKAETDASPPTPQATE